MLEWLFGLRAKINKNLELNEYRKRILELAAVLRDDKDLQEISHYLMKHKAKVLNYDFTDELRDITISIMYDTDGFPYIFREGKKLFFPYTWKKRKIHEYYQTLLEEQHKDSPHLYLTSELKARKYRVVIDIGGAEGILALDLLNVAQKIYIFEADPIWLEPLNRTFAEYKDKIVIVSKYVSDCSNNMYTTLDDLFSDRTDIDLIKMDVEGAELEVLRGSKVVLQNNNPTILACAYHYQHEYKDLCSELKEYRIKT